MRSPGSDGAACSPWPLEVFAVEPTSAQLVWRASPAEGLRIEVGDVVVDPPPGDQAELALSIISEKGLPPASAVAPARRRWSPVARGRRRLDPGWPAGPGAATVEGLAPGTCYEVVASAAGVPRFRAGQVRTLPAPEGRLLAQFATVSDVHIGERQFGVMGRLQDPARAGAGGARTALPFPERCLSGAVAEAAEWGAQLVVVKGDLTRTTVPAEVRDVGRVLSESPVPVEVMLGNHDNKLGVDVHAILLRQGHPVPWLPWARDLPGLRLLFANSNEADARYHRGHLDLAVSRRLVEMAAEAAAAGLPVWLALHHPPEMHPFPTVYPPGVPFRESRLFLSMLAAAQPASMVSCGHRHRNRRYDFGPVVISEVGSTKDYPGGWAGYRVYEGGLTQVVRRTARPDVIGWTEATRRAVNGQWGRWSPGRLEDRCFTVDWPRR